MFFQGHSDLLPLKWAGRASGEWAAAPRYTELRMAKLCLEMLRDINKNTVDYQANYDGREKEPVVLPARFPNLLVNGSSGIAVGMATNMAPHNLNEVIDGIIEYIDNNLCKYIPIDLFNTKGYEIIEKYAPRVDYLKIIDKVYGGILNE